MTPAGGVGSRITGKESSTFRSPKSPSSAAATAAAAAKLLCDPARMLHSAKCSTWYGSGGETDGEPYSSHDSTRRGSGGEYSHHLHARRSNQSGGECESQWSSHKPHFARTQNSGHEFGNERLPRNAKGAISHKRSHHQHMHPQHESLGKFETSEPEHHLNHHHQPHHNDSRRMAGRYTEIGSYDRAPIERQNEDNNVFRRQDSTVRVSTRWNDTNGSDRYEDEKQDINDSDGGSGGFTNENIPQHGTGHVYQEHAENETHHHRHNHLGNEDCGGGLVVVNRIKSSTMGMQNKKKMSEGSGGTSRVMGSPTPIHVPRASSSVATEQSPGNYPNKSQLQHDVGGTNNQASHSSERSSVFRTRLGSADTNRSGGCADGDTNNCKDIASPHALLLSLRTQTKSYDDRKKSSIEVDGKDECNNDRSSEETQKAQDTDDTNQESTSLQRTILLSPQNPPRIQHSHNQRMISNSLFFEPQRNMPQTPKTPRTPRTPGNYHFRGSKNNTNGGVNCPTSIDASPSFNLFDRSFDSPFIDAETYMQSPHCSPGGALKDLIFSPHCSPSQRSITTPRLPPRPSHSVTNSPYLATRNFSFSPRPSQGYRSNSNRQHNTGGTTSIISTPRGRDIVGTNLETSPCGLSLGSVGDMGPNPFGDICKSKPPIMPSAREMDKVTHNGTGVSGGGRTIMLGMSDRLIHTSHGSKGYNISSKGGFPIEDDVDGSGGQGRTSERLPRTTSQQHLQIPVCAKNCEDPAPSSSTNSNQVRINNSPLQHHLRHDAPPYVAEQKENLTNSGDGHKVGHPVQKNTPKDAAVPTSSSLKRKKITAPLNGMNAPHFYQKLTVHKDAFHRYKFLLPALKAAMSYKTKLTDLSNCQKDEEDSLPPPHQGGTVEAGMKTENSPPHRTMPMPQVSYSPDTQLPPTITKSSNIEVARRRLTSALCAFGGNNSLARKNSSSRKKSGTKVLPKSHTFKREQDNGGVSLEKSNVDSDTKSNKRTKYEAALANRYFENDNRISWEFEEDPPVVLSTTGLKNFSSTSDAETRQLTMNGETDIKLPSPNLADEDNQVQVDGRGNGNTPSIAEGKDHSSTSEDVKSVCSEISNKHHSDTSMSINSDQPKMRYRCKLCGQPKQNHTCPYQQSLQRSIGITVYPAVNAYTAYEPGTLAPTLSEMNNFVHGQDSFTENTPLRPDRMMLHQPTGPFMVALPGVPRNVTPESIRSALHHQITSPLSSMSHTPHRTPFRMGSSRHYLPPSCPKMIIGQSAPRSLDERRKRVLSPPVHSIPHSTNSAQNIFVDATELRPEQYRIVSSSVSHDTFEYPSLPLPYTQRKKLSDNLFALSKGIPQLTDECAAVLRQARELDLWDIAVAELMAQVIVVVHCPENDHRLDGLSRYLLSLGFAC